MSAARADVTAGIGFRSDARAEDITALVRAAFDRAGLTHSRLIALATALDRALEAPFREAAAHLTVPALGFDPGALQAVDDRVPTRSARIEAIRGVGSVAEAAALAAAGEAGELVLVRIANEGGTVTCALALSPPDA